MKLRSRSLPAMTQNTPCDTTETCRRASMPSRPEDEVARSSNPSLHEFSVTNDTHNEPPLRADIAQNDIGLRYKCLPDASRYIRLLKFQQPQSDPSDSVEIHCVLQTFCLDETPAYIAISYTWGRLTPTTTIHVDGFATHVGQTCEAVLRRAQAYDASTLYWIDAICIDQKNLKEKGKQVALMGRIFGGAQQVLAHVGDHADDSEFLFATIRSNFEIFTKLLGRPQHQSLSYKGRFEVALRIAMRNRREFQRLWQAQTAFPKREYFNRLWVYQELALGRKVDVHCGNDYLPFELLYGSELAISSWTNRSHGGLSNGFSVLPHSINSFVMGDRYINPMLRAGYHSAPSRIAPLIKDILKSRLRCHDRLDRIYGILSMVDWGSYQPIQPDYSRDRLDLAAETLSKSGSNDAHSYFSLASNVAELMELRPGVDISANLAKAIYRRQTPISSDEQGAPTLNGSWNVSVLFRGMRLGLDDDGRWAIQKPDNALKSAVTLRRHPRLYRHRAVDGDLRDKLSEKKTVLLPQSAEVGDWCLFNEFYDHRVLVVREHKQGQQFRIVGKGWTGLVSFEKWKGSFWRKFRVYLDAEDVLVEAATRPSNNGPLPNVELLEKYVGSGYCGDTWSSYAELARSDELEISEWEMHVAP